MFFTLDWHWVLYLQETNVSSASTLASISNMRYGFLVSDSHRLWNTTDFDLK